MSKNVGDPQALSAHSVLDTHLSRVSQGLSVLLDLATQNTQVSDWSSVGTAVLLKPVPRATGAAPHSEVSGLCFSPGPGTWQAPTNQAYAGKKKNVSFCAVSRTAFPQPPASMITQALTKHSEVPDIGRSLLVPNSSTHPVPVLTKWQHWTQVTQSVLWSQESLSWQKEMTMANH